MDLAAIVIFGLAGVLLVLGARNVFKKPASPSKTKQTKDSSSRESADKQSENIDPAGLIALAGCASVTFGLWAIAAGLVAVLLFIFLLLI